MRDIHGVAVRSGLLSKANDSTVHSLCSSKRGLALFFLMTVTCSLLAVEMDCKPRLRFIRDGHSRIVIIVVSPPRVIRYVHNLETNLLVGLLA